MRLDASETTGTLIEDNLIGTDRTGTVAVGNSSDGIEIEDASVSTVRNNTIAFNGDAGVIVVDQSGMALRNEIRQNSIFNNTDLGIDLGNDGVTANDVDDPDVGPNLLQNFPVITSAVINGLMLDIAYSVPSVAPNSAFALHLDFYIADSDNQEGQTFIGSDVYFGPGPEMVSVPLGAITGGTRILGTATDANGNTSEFSATVGVFDPNVPGDNDTIETATVLGSPTTVTLNDDTVGDGDEDYFKLTCCTTRAS